MNDSLSKLLSISSAPLAPLWGKEEDKLFDEFGRLGTELLDLLKHKNGFFAFESALHVLPLGSVANRLNLGSWNAPRTWSDAYGDLLPKSLLFFAQDIFGEQFCLTREGVSIFRPEDASLDYLSKTLAEWGEIFMVDWNYFSGWELGHDWQTLNRPLVEGERLIPKTPFVLGGKYEVENLYVDQIANAMRFRASLARRIATLPDGAAIEFKIT